MKKQALLYILAIFILLCGISVILGWIYDIPTLKSVLHGHGYMMPVTALSFILTALILLSAGVSITKKSLTADLIIGISSILIFLIMIYSLSSIIAFKFAGFEDLYLKNKSNEIFINFLPRLPSLGTAIAFLIIAITGKNLLIKSMSLHFYLKLNGIFILCISGIAVLGYALNMPILYYNIPDFCESMAIHTAIFLFLSGLAFILISSLPVNRNVLISIRKKILLVIIPLLLTSIVFVSVVATTISFSYLISGTLKDMNTINRLKSQHILSFFNDIKQDMQIIQKYYNIRKNLPILSRLRSDKSTEEYITAKRMLDDQLSEWTLINSSISAFILVNTEGEIVYEVDLKQNNQRFNGKHLKSVSEKAYIKGLSGIALNNIYTPNNPLYNEGFIYTTPVYGFDNALEGEVAVIINASDLIASMTDKRVSGETFENLIVKKDGDYIILLNHIDDSGQKLKVRIGDEIAEPAQLAVSKESGYGISIDYRGNEIIASWSYIPELDFGIVTKINVSEVLKHYKALNRLIIFISLLLMVISSLIITRISYSLTKSIRILQNGIKAVKEGNLDYKVSIGVNDEIGELSDEFDKMAENLNRITASKEELNSALKKVQESEQIYKAIGESINYGIWITDPDGKNIYMSQCCLDLIGMTQQEVSGDSWAKLLHPDDIENTLKAWKECVSTNGLWNIEHKILDKFGDFHYTLSHGVPVKDENGSIKYWAGINLDITELKKIQNELSMKNKLMFDMMDNSPALIYMFDLEGKLITSNNQFASLFSKRREELIGKRREEFIREDIALQHHQNDLKVIEQRGSLLLEETNIESGSIHYYHTVKFPLIDKQNCLYGVAGISSDITERKLIESTLLFLSQGAFRKKGENYYEALVKFLAELLNMDFAYIGRAQIGNPSGETIAVYLDGSIVENSTFNINETPCGIALGQSMCCYPDSIKSLFPDDKLLFDMDAASYAGATLWSSAKEPLGIIALIGRKPIKNPKLVESILQLVAGSAANEIEKNDANEKIRDSEEKYRSLVEVSQDAIFIMFRNTIIYSNKAALSLMGADSEDMLLGKNFFDFFHQDGKNILKEKIYAMMRENSNINVETEKIISFDGKTIDVEFSASPFIYKNKPAIQFVIRDITETLKKQQELNESRQQIEAIFELAKDGIIAADIETKKIVMANPTFLDKLCLDRSEIKKMTIYDIHPEDQMDLILDEFKKAALGLSSLAPNIPVKRKDGSLFYADISISKIVILERPCLLGIFHDITARKGMQEALSRNTQFRQGIIDAISANICVLNESGEIIAVNKAWLEFANSNPPVSGNIGVGTNYFSICNNTTGYDYTIAKNVLEGMRKLLNSDIELFSCEYPCHSPHKKRWFLLRAACVKPENNNMNKYIVIAHTDITDLKLLEENLLSEKEKAENANSAKTKFVSIMTHELRSPLNSIIGFTEILNRETYGQLNEKQKQFSTDILESGKHLLSLINDVLDIAKVDAGKMTLILTEVNINTLIINAISIFREVCRERDIKLDLTTDPELPVIKADERKLKQVIYNLLSNAIKFTPDGGEIGIATYPDKDYIIVSVKDSGIGIEEKDAHKVFQEFEQIDSTQSRKFSGTGIGMPISKKLMMLHGGDVWFESEGSKKGTTFFISIPYKLSLEPHTDSEKPDLQWRSDYELNFREIDSQHEKLLDFVSVLNEDLDSDTKRLVLKNVCKTLVEYTHYHFETEEKLMKDYDYPDIASHLQTHKIFIEKTQDFSRRIDTDADLDKEVVAFVREWLINHILTLDSKLCEYLKSKGVSG